MKLVEKTIEKNFSLFFRDPIDELNQLNKEEVNTQNKKKQIVIELAKRLELEGDVAIDTICMIIIQNLQGVLKPRTIREYLSEKYKPLHRVINAQKQKNEQPELIPMDNLAAEPPLNQEAGSDMDTIVIDTKDKISIEEKEASIQPFSPVDISVLDVNLVKSSIKPETHSYEQAESDYNIRQNECPECPKKYVKILELTEIIEKLEKFTTADKLLDNKEVPYEFNILFEELRNKMQEIFRLLGDKVKVNFKGVVDTTTGETTLLFYGSPAS
jgi:hypothetical protein